MYRNIDDDQWRIGCIEILPAQRHGTVRSHSIVKQHSNNV